MVIQQDVIREEFDDGKFDHALTFDSWFFKLSGAITA